MIVYILIIYSLNKLLKLNTSSDKFVTISEISKKIYILRKTKFFDNVRNYNLYICIYNFFFIFLGFELHYSPSYMTQ